MKEFPLHIQYDSMQCGIAYSHLKKEIAAAYNLQSNQKATATIVINNKTVWQRMVKK